MKVVAVFTHDLNEASLEAEMLQDRELGMTNPAIPYAKRNLLLDDQKEIKEYLRSIPKETWKEGLIGHTLWIEEGEGEGESLVVQAELDEEWGVLHYKILPTKPTASIPKMSDALRELLKRG